MLRFHDLLEKYMRQSDAWHLSAERYVVVAGINMDLFVIGLLIVRLCFMIDIVLFID